MEDVAREDRQQRCGAAQQHREQVERQHAEQHRAGADKVNAGKQCGQAGRLTSRRWMVVAQARHQHHGREIEQGGDTIDHTRSGDVEESAERGSGDHRDLSGGGIGGHGLGQGGQGHQARDHRLHRGELERLAHADHQHQREDRGLTQPSAQAAGCQDHNGDPFEQLTAHDHPTAIDLICHMTGGQRQQYRGDELYQADQAEIKWVAGDVVDLPAYRHRHHLKAEAGRHAGGPELAEGRVAAQRIDRALNRGGGTVAVGAGGQGHRARKRGNTATG